MASNDICINGSKELTWIVGDSKMEEMIAYLDEIGHKVKKPANKKLVN